MKLFGLTGGIGTGKTFVSLRVAAFGFPVVDTDVIARELCQPGSDTVKEVAHEFGGEFLTDDQALDRQRLGAVVFRSADKRRRLERILHPRIRDKWTAEAVRWRDAGAAVGFVVIPLLYETDAGPLFDQVICTACSEATQAMRLRARGWDEQHLQARIDSQLPLREKMARADFVIWTEGDHAASTDQLRRVLRSAGVTVNHQ